MKCAAILSLLIGLLVGVVDASAQERINLTGTETKPSNSQYVVERVTLQYDDASTASVDEGAITIQLLGQNRESRTCLYNASTTPTATTLLNALNKADLSSTYAANATTGTLKQRIFHRLAVMGEGVAVCGVTVSGTVAGTVP